MNIRLRVVAGLLLLAGLAIGAYCLVGTLSGEANNTIDDPARLGSVIVSVNQRGMLPADLAELQLVIETEHPESLLQAEQLNQDITKRLFNSLKAELNLEAGDYLKSIAFKADTRYETQDKQRKLVGYQVVHTVQLSTVELSKLSSLIKLALASGATRVDRVVFSLRNQSDACKALMDPAVTLAKQRGKQLATLAGGRLRGIKQLTSHCSATNYMPLRNYRGNMGGSDSVAVSLASSNDSAISAGDLEVELQINAEWYVENATVP